MNKHSLCPSPTYTQTVCVNVCAEKNRKKQDKHREKEKKGVTEKQRRNHDRECVNGALSISHAQTPATTKRENKKEKRKKGERPREVDLYSNAVAQTVFTEERERRRQRRREEKKKTNKHIHTYTHTHTPPTTE